MAKSGKERSEKANRDAQARGWSSRGQEYRAHKIGLVTPREYQRHLADAAQKRTVERTIKKAQSAKGVTGSSTYKQGRGAILTAEMPGQLDRQWSLMSSFPRNKHVTIVVEASTGQTFNLGTTSGGYSLGYLRDLVEQMGSWEAALLYLLNTVMGPKAKNKSAKGNRFVPSIEELDEEDQHEDDVDLEDGLCTVTIS